MPSQILAPLSASLPLHSLFPLFSLPIAFNTHSSTLYLLRHIPRPTSFQRAYHTRPLPLIMMSAFDHLLGLPTHKDALIQPPLTAAELDLAHPQLASVYAMSSGGLGSLPHNGLDTQLLIVQMRAETYSDPLGDAAKNPQGVGGEGWGMLAATAQSVLVKKQMDPREPSDLVHVMPLLLSACKHTLAMGDPVAWEVFEARHLEPARLAVEAVENAGMKRVGLEMIEAVKKEAKIQQDRKVEALGNILWPMMRCVQKHAVEAGPMCMYCKKHVNELPAGKTMKKCSR